MTESSPTVLVFRKRLLPYSETFIAAQGRALRRYHPVFVGYESDDAGAHYLDGSERILLSENSLIPPMSKYWLKRSGKVPRRWLKAMRASRPTLVHAHFAWSIKPAHPIADALGVPLIVTFHGRDIAREARSEEDARTRRAAFAHVDRAIAVSGFIAERLLAAGFPAERMTLHRIGVDTAVFQPTDVPPVSGRVLFVGRLTKKKGLAHLLRAFPHIQKRVPNAELIVIGDGELRPSLEALARTLRVRVQFTGVQSPAQIAQMLKTAVLLAAPSIMTASGDAEGMPITMMEAMASGVPVVAFPSGGSAEGVRDGETGRLLPAGDEAALAAAIIEVLSDDQMRARMSRASRALAEQEFSLQRQTEKLEQIYDEVRQKA